MAHFFDKTTCVDNYPSYGTGRILKTLVLNEREAYIQPFGFSNWNSVRIAITFSFTGLSNDNETPAHGDYRLGYTPVSPRDLFYIGLKPATKNFPGEGRDAFIGVIGGLDNSANPIEPYFHVAPNGNEGCYMGGNYMHSVILPNYSRAVYDVGSHDSCSFLGLSQRPDWVTSFETTYILQFDVFNKGLSNQYIKISDYFNRTVNYITTDDYFGSYMSMIGSASVQFISYAGYTFNGTALPLPNAIFFYSPIRGIRMRVHRAVVMRNS